MSGTTFERFSPGVGMIDKDQVNRILAQGGSGYGSTTTVAITARAGGTQALSVPLTTAMNNISVCATAGDSVSLQSAVGGQSIFIANAGAASLNIFSAIATPTDTINGTIGTTAYALAAGKIVEAISIVPGAWRMLLSA